MPQLSQDRSLPSAISNLRLCAALNDCGALGVTNASLNYLTNLQRAAEGSSQLWHTFDTIIRPRCVKLSIDPMQKISVDFHVVFDSDYIVTSANAELQDFKTQFLDEKRIKLSFDNEKDFL